jgi:DNA-binding MarR family transcriptional regulator
VNRNRPDVVAIADDLEIVLGRLRRRMRSEAPPDGIPLSQMVVLNRLERDGPQTTSALAAVEHVRPQSMASTVASLIGQQLITRFDHATDRRSSLIDITDAGRSVVLSNRRSRGAWLARAIATTLGAAQQRTLAEAIALLGQLIDFDPDAPADPAPPGSVRSGRDGSKNMQLNCTDYLLTFSGSRA